VGRHWRLIGQAKEAQLIGWAKMAMKIIRPAVLLG